MKSGLTPLFSDADIDRWFDKFQERAEERIFKLLSAAGEKFVEVARKSGNYTDRTGNLRSSVGYIIAMDGETVSENFEKAVKGMTVIQAFPKPDSWPKIFLWLIKAVTY